MTNHCYQRTIQAVGDLSKMRLFGRFKVIIQVIAAD
jgi:hypothetical protein